MQATANSNMAKAMIALMLVLFIDGMGQGLIFPILTSVLTNPHATIILITPSKHVREIWYGVIVSAYFLMWFASVAVLGDWSDNVGRKKALILCLIVAVISFLLSALSFAINSIVLLLISRFVGGVASGDQAIAQAAVIDLCPPEKKHVYLGLVLLSVTLGLVIGPLIGAFFENPNYVSWFNVKTPFYFATILTLINIVLLWWFFKETHPVTEKRRLQLSRTFQVFIEAFEYRPVRYLLVSFFLAQAGWIMFYVYTADYIALKYHADPNTVGWILALMGAGLGVGLGLLPGIVKTNKHKLTACIGFMCVGILSAAYIIAKNVLLLWIITLPGVALFGLGYAHLLVLFSEAVGSERQGWIMGITGSVVALTGGIDSLMDGFFASINLHLPYVYSVVLTFIGAVMFLFYRKKGEGQRISADRVF